MQAGEDPFEPGGRALIQDYGEREDMAIICEILATVGPGPWWLATHELSLPFPSSLPAAMYLPMYVHDLRIKENGLSSMSSIVNPGPGMLYKLFVAGAPNSRTPR